jgi:formylglycine-generating enzyme required for sulfatase activity
MAGNVAEWVQSEYKAYPYRADDGRENLDSTNVRVLRGGSWDIEVDFVRAAYRNLNYPTLANSGLGFRCAR